MITGFTRLKPGANERRSKLKFTRRGTFSDFFLGKKFIRRRNEPFFEMNER
jgi:hypothetical protein